MCSATQLDHQLDVVHLEGEVVLHQGGEGAHQGALVEIEDALLLAAVLPEEGPDLQLATVDAIVAPAQVHLAKFIGLITYHTVDCTLFFFYFIIDFHSPYNLFMLVRARLME